VSPDSSELEVIEVATIEKRIRIHDGSREMKRSSGSSPLKKKLQTKKASG
jgi:hypothetical protein